MKSLKCFSYFDIMTCAVDVVLKLYEGCCICSHGKTYLHSSLFIVRMAFQGSAYRELFHRFLWKAYFCTQTRSLSWVWCRSSNSLFVSKPYKFDLWVSILHCCQRLHPGLMCRGIPRHKRDGYRCWSDKIFDSLSVYSFLKKNLSCCWPWSQSVVMSKYSHCTTVKCCINQPSRSKIPT